MREDELLTAIRVSAFIPDSHPDYTDSRLRTEATDTLQTVFERAIVNARQGYWLKTEIRSTVANQDRYRIPYRAITGGLEKLELADDGVHFRRLTEISPRNVTWYEESQSGTPLRYVVLGDEIQLLPPAPNATMALRFSYYVRPSKLVQFQTAGRVTSVNTATREITVNAIPLDRDTGLAITTSTLLDVVRANGWHELSLVGASVASIVGTVITIGGTVDLASIAVGDYVRAAEQTDWPALPDDFHRALADSTAIVVLTSLGAPQKAQTLAQKTGTDLQRFQDLLQPRVKDSPRIIKPQYTFLRRGGRFRYPIAPS